MTDHWNGCENQVDRDASFIYAIPFYILLALTAVVLGVMWIMDIFMQAVINVKSKLSGVKNESNTTDSRKV